MEGPFCPDMLSLASKLVDGHLDKRSSNSIHINKEINENIGEHYNSPVHQGWDVIEIALYAFDYAIIRGCEIFTSGRFLTFPGLE
jgi:hypothetical protein